MNFKSQLSFVLKVFVLSTLISYGIKYQSQPLLEAVDKGFLALFLVTIPGASILSVFLFKIMRKTHDIHLKDN